MANSKRDEAVELLDHYITMLMEREGTRRLRVDGDTHIEIARIVDAIVEAAIDEIRNIVRDGVIREGE